MADKFVSSKFIACGCPCSWGVPYELGAIQTILRHKSPSTTERYLKRIGLERVREVMEDLSKGKGGEVVEFKHWPQKIALPGLQE
jgi:hypothetical protein